MSDEDAKLEVVHLARNRLLLALPLPLWCLTFAELGAVLTGFGEPALASVLAALASLLAGGVSLQVWKRNLAPRRLSRAVVANAAGLRLGERFLQRKAIKQGFLVQRGGQTLVALVQPLAPDVELVMKNEEEGRRFLRALGLDASQKRGRILVMSSVASSLRWAAGSVVLTLAGLALMVALACNLGAHKDPVILAGMIAMLAWWGQLLVPTRVDVGVDGLVITWLWRKRFVAFAEVAKVERFSDSSLTSVKGTGVALTLRSGEIVRLSAGTPKVDEEHTDKLMALLDEAMRQFHAGVGPGVDTSAWRRGAEDLHGWVARLRGVGLGANADHRMAVRREHLAGIARDPHRAPLERAAAAVALSGLEQDARDELRTLGEAVAAPKLRVAFAAAAGGHDAELEAALAELEASAGDSQSRPQAAAKSSLR
jgi:hypothetical protein